MHELSHTYECVLLQVLMTLVRSMAPFTPMFCELLYLNLRHMLPQPERADSVHFLDFPQPNLEALDERMELKVARMQTLIEKGRAARDKRGISLRTPVRSVTVICPDSELLADLEQLQGYIKDELNIRAVVTTTGACHINLYNFMFMCRYICTYVYIYICIYTYIYI